MTRTIARVADWAPVTLTVVVLTVISAARTLHMVNADALLPALMSTQRLTWFYWGQDRLANVVPLVASPIRDVRWNLALQMFLIGLGWFVLAALFAANHLTGRGVDRRVRRSVVAASTISTGFATWLVLPDVTEVVFLFEQLYAFAFALFLFGLVGVTRDGWAARVAGALAVLLATLINPSLLLYAPFGALLPGVTALRIRGRLPVPTNQLIGVIGVPLAAFVFTTIASARYGDAPEVATGYNEFSLERMWNHTSAALGNVGGSLRGPAALVVLPLAALLLARRADMLERRVRWTYCCAPAFALLWTFVFSGNQWVLANQLYPRYFFPLYAMGLLLVAGAAAELFTMLTDSRRLRRLTERVGATTHVGVRLAAAAAVVAPVAGVGLVGQLGIDALERSEPLTEAMRTLDVDFVAGSYWVAWPAVVEARAQGLDVLGVADRAEAIQTSIAARIAHDAANHDPIRVMCTDQAAEPCGGAVIARAPIALRVSGTVSAAPLVIELAPSGQ